MLISKSHAFCFWLKDIIATNIFLLKNKKATIVLDDEYEEHLKRNYPTIHSEIDKYIQDGLFKDIRGNSSKE